MTADFENTSYSTHGSHPKGHTQRNGMAHRPISDLGLRSILNETIKVVAPPRLI